MPTKNLEKLVQAARDKKPTVFKQHLHAEIGTRAEAGIAEIRADLAKNMFTSKPVTEDHCEGAEVEHTHDDGTTHTHEEGGHPHSHGEDGEMIPEGKLPPALQKAVDAKKKNNSDDDDEDKTPAKEEKEDDEEDEDKDPVGEDTDKSEPGTQGDDAEYAKKRDAVLKKFGVKSCAALSTEEEKKACFKALDDAHVADHEE